MCRDDIMFIMFRDSGIRMIPRFRDNDFEIPLLLLMICESDSGILLFQSTKNRKRISVLMNDLTFPIYIVNVIFGI